MDDTTRGPEEWERRSQFGHRWFHKQTDLQFLKMHKSRRAGSSESFLFFFIAKPEEVAFGISSKFPLRTFITISDPNIFLIMCPHPRPRPSCNFFED